MSSPDELFPSIRSRFLSVFGTANWTLRNELIASHTALAALIVLGFGISLYWMMARATYRQAEADLLGAAQMLIRDLSDNPAASSLTISEIYLHRFGKAPRDHAYFAVWDADGQRIAGTNPLPPHAVPSDKAPPTRGPHPFLTRTHGPHLDVLLATPQHGQLLIGRPLAKERDWLRSVLVELLLIGIVCLCAGVGGAWWLARRLSQPIARMADTAETINSRNLSQRLDVGGTPQEIARLATVFNGMLDGLRTAFERQIRFTADASHELRTPVSVVLSQAEHTLSRERSSEDYREALQTCLRSAQRMKKLVDDLLLLARADSERLDLRKEPLDLCDVVCQAVELLRPLAASKAIRLETDLKPTLLVGDAARLGQVVTNLVTNALQYNVLEGEVLIRVFPAPAAAVLIVQDHGLGIPLADQPLVFNRFHRVDRARTHENDTGTGLGLSLVAEIVAAHQGTIQVSSVPGEGTLMTVRIPVG